MSWMKRPRAGASAPQGAPQHLYNPTQPPLPGQPAVAPPQQQQWGQNQTPGQPLNLPTYPPGYQQQTQPPQQQYWQPQNAQQTQPAPQNFQNPRNVQAQQYPNQQFTNPQYQQMQNPQRPPSVNSPQQFNSPQQTPMVNSQFVNPQFNNQPTQFANVQPVQSPVQQNMYQNSQNVQQADYYQYNQQQYQQGQQNNYQQFDQPQYNAANNYTHQNSGQDNRETNEADPWSWGEDSSAANQVPANQTPQIALGDSFSNTDNWNWSVEDSSDRNSASRSRQSSYDAGRKQSVEKAVEDSGNLVSPGQVMNVQNKPSSDQESLIEHNSSSRRFQNDNLTPQWSTESQPSQDSSDGLLSHTESTNKSEDPSRSSKSSPEYHANDNTNFNYAQPSESLSESSPWEAQRFVPPNLVNSLEMPDNGANLELVDDMRSMSLNQVEAENNDGRMMQNLDTVPNADRGVTPPSKNVGLPPSIPSFPSQPGGSSNPYKKLPSDAGEGLSSRMAVPFAPQQVGVIQNQIQLLPPANQGGNSNIVYSSPRNSASQNSGFSTANLETTPDNSERPDQPSPMNYVQMTPPKHANVYQNVVENFEIAPSNDRNEYLQTGHLSEAGYNNSNFSNEDLTSRNSPNVSQENYPPPGFRRMVLGQPETEFGQNSSFSNDEPPPGLSRMIPGQPTDSMNMYSQPNDYLDRQVDGQTTESDSLTNSACMARNPPVFRQVDGQPTDDESNYNQGGSSRSSADRRPIGFDRMVPGESSNSNFNMQSFQNQSFGEERVVTGLEQDNSNEPREQNMDGSDYSEVDNQVRNVVGATENMDARNNINDIPAQSISMEPDLQRDLNMDGENLQDLSTVSSTDFSMVRDQNLDGADLIDEQPIRSLDMADSAGSERPTNQSKGAGPSQKQSSTIGRDQQSDKDSRKYRDDTTGDESERDRLIKMSSPRKEKDRLRTSKERDGRYNDRREERRSEKDRRGEGYRGERGDDRRYRKSNKDSRYETEDTDYYSDKERRRYREGSHPAGKPPRPESSRRDEDSRRSYDRSTRDDKDRRRRDDRDKRYDSYESERDGTVASSTRRRDKDRGYEPRDKDREWRYGGSERDRNYGRKEKTGGREDRKRDPRDGRYPPARASSRDPSPEQEALLEAGASRELRRSHRDRRHRREHEYAEDYQRYEYGMDPYSRQMYQQQQTYQYYEKLRLTNPQAYLEIYNKYMRRQAQPTAAGDPSRGMPPYTDGYTSLPGYEMAAATRLGDERGSVHSGRSSANGDQLKERDFNTDASLNLVLDDSTVKSERMTPVKFATAHIKGVMSSTNLVTVNPAYPVDGQPAIVEILDLNKILINDPVRCELTAYPGPLVKGTTHKKTVIEYCESKIRAALDRQSVQSHSLMAAGGGGSSMSAPDRTASHTGSLVLMWELLVLLLRQNGMMVGTDIAELLVKNRKQFVWRGGATTRSGLSRRDSASSATSRSAELPLEEVAPLQDNQVSHQEHLENNDSSGEVSGEQSHSGRLRSGPGNVAASKLTGGPPRKSSSNLNLDGSQGHAQETEKYVTDRFREYLLFGNGKEALEWAMSHGLWGHALFLASKLDRRTYANVMARFANGLVANDPLQTLYQLMSGRQPASVTCVSDEKWGDWRPHLAMILSNSSQRPELDRKSILTLGDTLLSRGDLYAAQFCYLMSREDFAPRLAPQPPRLVLLGAHPAAPQQSLQQFASNEAIIMTEIYEYACSLADDTFVLHNFQVYKYILATRLLDYGLYEQAFFYTEKLGSVIAAAPDRYQPTLVDRVLQLADRLKRFDPEENVGEMLDDADRSSSAHNTPDYSPRHAFPQRPAEQAWITGLRRIVDDYHTGAIIPSNQYTQHQQQEYDQSYQQQQQQNYQHQYTTQTSQNSQSNWNQTYTNAVNYDQAKMQPIQNDQNYQAEEVNTFKAEENQAPMLYDPSAMQTSGYYGQQLSNEHGDGNVQDEYPAGVVGSDSGYWNHEQAYGYREDDPPATEAPEDFQLPPAPQITMPNSTSGHSPRSTYPGEEPDNQQTSAQAVKKPQEAKKKSEDSQKGQQGWFGGIFNKLSLKPKNQMILPDDKNPTIVWDPEKKKWTNLDADEDEQSSQLALPPKMADIMRPNNNYPAQTQAPQVPSATPAYNSTVDSNQPPSANQNMPNIFKLQKGRHIKKSYVDVFNPSGAPIRPLPPASEVLGAPPAPAPTAYFTPGAQNNNNPQTPTFYNPSEY